MKWECIDQDGELLAVVEADDEATAWEKAPAGTCHVTQKSEKISGHCGAI